jgi:hypothetical protein
VLLELGGWNPNICSLTFAQLQFNHCAVAV